MPGSGCAFPLYYRTETSFPYDNKRSARMRQGTFFFIILVALDKMKNVAYSL